jgi:hypothetical protein
LGSQSTLSLLVTCNCNEPVMNRLVWRSLPIGVERQTDRLTIGGAPKQAVHYNGMARQIDLLMTAVSLYTAPLWGGSCSIFRLAPSGDSLGLPSEAFGVRGSRTWSQFHLPPSRS